VKPRQAVVLMYWKIQSNWQWKLIAEIIPEVWLFGWERGAK